MKFLIDECLRPALAERLRAAGEDAVHVTEIGLAGSDDTTVMERARIDGRVVVSADTDFGEMLAASAATWPSVVLFRGRSHRAEDLAGVLLSMLPTLEADLDGGSIAVIGHDRVRVRSLPIGG